MKKLILLLIVIANICLFLTPRSRAVASPIGCTENALRNAVTLGGTIVLPEGCIYTLTADLPLANTSITVQGNGAVIDGDYSYRIFQATESAGVTLFDLTLQNGFAGEYQDGGAVAAADGNVTINNCRFLYNWADQDGGAVAAENGEVTITDSVFTGNRAAGDFTPGGSAGGAVYAAYGSVSIENSTFQKNVALGGGAIYVGGGTLTIAQSAFARNRAEYAGGAVSGGDMTINNSTFFNNAASVDSGGALYSQGQLTLISSTVTANRARYDGGIAANYVIPIFSQSIIVGNNAGYNENISTPLKSEGYNLLGSEQQDAEYLAETDIIADQPGFEVFSGEVLPLTRSSPALDAVPLGNCATAQDQRSFSRSLGAACDIGAVEMEWSPIGELIPILPAENAEHIAATTEVACSEDALRGALKIGGTLELATDCTYTLTRNLPFIVDDIIIHGHGATLDGNHTYRILYLPDETQVTLEDITIKQGYNRIGGGGLYAPQTDVTITNSTFSANRTLESAGAVLAQNATITDSTFDGNSEGAVQVYEKVVVIRCTFSNNWLEYSSGGGLWASEIVVIDSIFTENEADSGGGMSGNTITVTGSRFLRNHAARGGGIYGSNITIENSVLAENVAQFGGGASGEILHISNSTFSSNTAKKGPYANPADGGGVSGQDITIINSTFFDNQSGDFGGAVSAEYGSLTLQQSIIAGNHADVGPDIYVGDLGDFYTLGYNLIGDDNAGSLAVDPTDIISPEPDLTSFYQNEGVYFLTESSAALDMVPASECETTSDQRGTLRPQDSGCDSGAVEMERAANGTLLIPSLMIPELNPAQINCTERALTEAVSSGGLFELPHDCTITLTSDLPQIEQSLILDGNGATIDGDNTYRIFYTAVADITLSNITVQHGVDSGLTAERGDVTLSHCTFRNNSSGQYGGGVRVDKGQVTISYCTFSENRTGDEGGGVYVSEGDASISYSSFLGNRAEKQGGGIRVHGATISNSTFSENSAGNRGGGVFSSEGTVTITSSTLTENQAQYGGGFYGGYNIAKLLLKQSIIAGNSGSPADIEVSEFTSEGYNLIGDDNLGSLLIVSDDIVSAQPGLDMSIDNVYLLRPDSPAVDAIPPLECALVEDQRGVARPQGNGCDIGAVEMEQSAVFIPQPPTPTPTISAIPQAVECSENALVEAIHRGGTIDMPAGCIIALTEDLPKIELPITINGNRSTLDGGGRYRLLYAPGLAAITLTDLTLQNGRGNPGGAIHAARGDVSINRCIFSGNEAEWPAKYLFGSGGAVYAGSGQVTIIDSIFMNNSARSYGGGGIFVENGDVWITGSAFINNSANYYGGGVFVRGEGSLTIANTTFSHNYAREDGGAVFVWDRPFEITHSTITENSADRKGGGVEGFAATGTVSRSILTGNTAPEYPDFEIYNFHSEGYNLLGEGYSGGSSLTFQQTDITQQEPNLVPLSDNVYLLKDNSPALDAIPVHECTLSVDQRGVPRPQGSSCDIGAVEMGSETPLATTTPTPVPESAIAVTPSTTFSAPVGAIACTEAALTSALTAGGTINLPPDCAFALSADLPEIIVDVVINGNGATIDGKDTYRLLYAPGTANLTLNQIILKKGKAQDGGAAIYAYGGDVTVNNSTLTRNYIENGNGGAIYVYQGQLSIKASTLSLDLASDKGGAIYTSYGTVTLENSRIAQNSAGIDGGGIYSYQGEVVISNSLFTGNTAGENYGSGGGLAVEKASATVINSIFSLNQSVVGGGAIRADNLTLISSTIVQNLSGDYGGGLSIWGQQFILQQSIVADNLSDNGTDIYVSHGGFESLGYNLLSDNAILRSSFLPTDIVTSVYGLAGSDDGSVVLLEGSPAWDAIPPAECASATDQRGVVRPQGAGCDIGAMEMGNIMVPPVPTATTPTPTSILPETTTCPLTVLNEAISAGGTVELAADCIYYLTEDLPEITTDIVIHGNGAVIDGGNTYRLLYAPGDANIIVESLTLRNGATEFGGGIFAISGAVILTDSLLTGNTARRSGGGVYVLDGSVTITASTITENTARNHGGGITAKTGSVQITESLVGDNIAGGRGGGLYTQGKIAQIVGSTVRGNQSAQSGGGIYAQSEEVLIENSLIAANTVDGGFCLGGGLYAEQNLIIRHSTLDGNSCNDYASIYSRGDVTVEASDISHNSGPGLSAGGDVMVQDSTFSDNGQIALQSGGRVSVIRSTFSDNGAWGIDGYNDIDIDESQFEKNGGGVKIASDYSHHITITNSVFVENTAVAVFIYTGNITATNSIFIGNTGEEGGAIRFGSKVNPLETDEVRLINCTVSNNRATTGGGVFLGSGTLVLQQSIVVGNVADSEPDIAIQEPARLESLGYNLIGENNSSELPLVPTDRIALGMFIGDLPEDSPALDAVPVEECATSVDQRGIIRPQNQACDIGAIEMQPH